MSTYKITMRCPMKKIDLNDSGLSYSEALIHIKAYIKKNPAPHYFIEDEKSGEEFEIGREEVME